MTTLASKIGCLPVPCTTCPYRRDVPSGIWHADEYAKLPPYDRPTCEQPPSLFMCHQNSGGLCTGWLQSHANREHAFDLLALRLHFSELDAKQISDVALSDPQTPLFRTGSAAARHGMKAIKRPGKKAVGAIQRIESKRQKAQA